MPHEHELTVAMITYDVLRFVDHNNPANSATFLARKHATDDQLDAKGASDLFAQLSLSGISLLLESSRLVPKGLLMARTQLQEKDDSGVPSRPMPGQWSPDTFPSAGHTFLASETTLVTHGTRVLVQQTFFFIGDAQKSTNSMIYLTRLSQKKTKVFAISGC